MATLAERDRGFDTLLLEATTRRSLEEHPHQRTDSSINQSYHLKPLPSIFNFVFDHAQACATVAGGQ